MVPPDSVRQDGPKIMELRRARGWSRPALTGRINRRFRTARHYKSLANVERETRQASVEFLREIAKVLGVPVSEIARQQLAA